MNETIIAVGNGGYNLAQDIIKAGIFPDAQLIVCDTDSQTLEKNSENAVESFLLDKIRGKVKSYDTVTVEDIVDKTADTVIICVTLGGMAGTKYAPLIALNARMKGKFVCSLFSMPYEFEGEMKGKRAMNARMQLIVSSNLCIQQNNERLKEVGSLGLNDMNKPLVDSLSSALRDKSLEELPVMVGTSIQEYTPKEYRVEDTPLIWWLRNNAYLSVLDNERKELFDRY